MTTLSWQEGKNLENSLVDYLTTESSGLTVFHQGTEKTIDVKVGYSTRDDWQLPLLSVYHDSVTPPKPFIGQTKLLKTHLMFVIVRALNDGMRSDLADWVIDKIKSGFTYYTYTPNVSTPDTPTKTSVGKVSTDFVSVSPIRSNENIELIDKYRHSISFNAEIAI